MACGCAYVSADYGGQKKYSQDGINVLLSRPKDVEGMLRNVIKVFDNDQLLINLAKAGIAEIEKRDWSNSVQLFEDILKSNFFTEK